MNTYYIQMTMSDHSQAEGHIKAENDADAQLVTEAWLRAAHGMVAYLFIHNELFDCYETMEIRRKEA